MCDETTLSKEDHTPQEILYKGKRLTQCTRSELMRLAYDAVRLPNVSHVTFTRLKRSS
jgi:hypothetical protein